jgi:hypothetical protein
MPTLDTPSDNSNEAQGQEQEEEETDEAEASPIRNKTPNRGKRYVVNSITARGDLILSFDGGPTVGVYYSRSKTPSTEPSLTKMRKNIQRSKWTIPT